MKVQQVFYEKSNYDITEEGRKPMFRQSFIVLSRQAPAMKRPEWLYSEHQKFQ